jgi:gluconolactonase
MLQPPSVIQTEVFACLPASLQIKNRKSDWLEVLGLGTDLGSFLEGPSFDREGNLYVVDIPYGRIFRVTLDGNFHLVAEYDGEPNGLKIHKDGRIFIADHKNGIMLFDPASGTVESYYDRPVLERFRGVNDLFFAESGNLYFTDQGRSGLQDPTGRVFRLRPDGALDKILDTVPSPNGLVTNPQETVLFVGVTHSSSVWRAPLLKDGSASAVGVMIYLQGGVGPDGMAFDEDGNLAVCHPGLGVVWLFSPLGEPLYRIESCAGVLPTNCAYGGLDGKSLFITESQSGTILRAEMPTPGRVMYSHMT